jgi:hypothetical protein
MPFREDGGMEDATTAPSGQQTELVGFDAAAAGAALRPMRTFA